MLRLSESRSSRRSAGRRVLAILAVLSFLSHGACAQAEKTLIRRSEPGQHALHESQRTSTSGTTLVFLGSLLVGAILIRRVVQQRRRLRDGSAPPLPIVVHSKERIDVDLTVRVLQVGSRLLIVGSSPQGLSTLSEFTDPREIEAMTGQERPRSAQAASAEGFSRKPEQRHTTAGRRLDGTFADSPVGPTSHSSERTSARQYV